MNVYVDDELVLTWSAQEGTSDFQEVPDIQGYSGQEIMFESAGNAGDWLAILEVCRIIISLQWLCERKRADKNSHDSPDAWDSDGRGVIERKGQEPKLHVSARAIVLPTTLVTTTIIAANRGLAG